MTTDTAPTFTINGSAVTLVPQGREPFSWLASQVYRHLHGGAPLPALLGMLAHEGLTAQSLPPEDARVQAISGPSGSSGCRASGSRGRARTAR